MLKAEAEASCLPSAADCFCCHQSKPHPPPPPPPPSPPPPDGADVVALATLDDAELPFALYALTR